MLSSSPVYKIHYFGVAGRSEPLKLILEDAGVAYEQVSYSKPDHLRLGAHIPFGQLPALEIIHPDGGRSWLTQTTAIALFLAQKHGYVSKDALRAAHSVETFCATQDLMAAFFSWRHKRGVTPLPFVFPLKGEQREDLLNSVVPKFFNGFELLLAQRGSPAGDGEKAIFFDDLALFDIVDMMQKSGADGQIDKSKYPLLMSLVAQVSGRPKISSYLQSERRFRVENV